MPTTVTCHTADCPNEGVGIPMELTGTDPDTGETWEVTSVQCGPCGHPITDLGTGNEAAAANESEE